MIDETPTTLGALLKKSGGSLKTGPFGTTLKAAEYSKTGGVPIISVGEVGYGTLRVKKSTPRVGNDVLRRLPEYILRPGDIVFGRKGAVDRCALVREGEDGYFLGSDGIRLRLKIGSGIDAEFLTYHLQSSRIRNWLIGNSSGTTMASLNQEILGRVPVDLPTLPEQRRAAEALSAADDLIATLEHLIVKKQAIKQGMMQQLLTGRTRLPGFDSEWKDATLGSLARVTGGGTPSTRIASYWGGDIPWFTPAEILAGGSGLVSHSKRTITFDGLAQSAASLLPAGSVLVTSRASIGNCAVSAIPVTTNQGFTSMIPRDPRSIWFLYYWIQQNSVELESRAAGSTFLEISASKVSAIPLRQPNLDEQSEIGTAIRDTDIELDVLGHRLSKAQAIKTGMMQQLLTGRTRLPVEATS